MKKNKLKLKKINKSKARITSDNTLNQNEIYDVLENNISMTYTNSILDENNIPIEDIGTILPQDNINEQNTDLINQDNTDVQNPSTINQLNNIFSQNDNIQNTNTSQNNISNENEDYEVDKYYLSEQGHSPNIQQNYTTQQYPGIVIPPYFPPQQGPGPVIPPGQKMPNIKIKSVYTNTFIIPGNEDILYAVGTDYNKGEAFRIIPVTSTHVILRVVGEGFIRINNQGSLIADVNKDKASRFIIFRNGSMTFTLLAPNGKFVEIRPRDNMLVASCSYSNCRCLFRFPQLNH